MGCSYIVTWPSVRIKVKFSISFSVLHEDALGSLDCKFCTGVAMWEVCTALSVIYSPGFKELGELSRLELWAVIRGILCGDTECYEISPKMSDKSIGIKIPRSSREHANPPRISVSNDEVVEPCLVKVITHYKLKWILW